MGNYEKAAQHKNCKLSLEEKLAITFNNLLNKKNKIRDLNKNLLCHLNTSINEQNNNQQNIFQPYKIHVNPTYTNHHKHLTKRKNAYTLFTTPTIPTR